MNLPNNPMALALAARRYTNLNEPQSIWWRCEACDVRWLGARESRCWFCDEEGKTLEKACPLLSPGAMYVKWSEPESELEVVERRAA